MTKCITQYDIFLDKDVQISFSLNDCFVETISDEGTSDEESGNLRITIQFEKKSYSSLADASIFTRAKYLSILGILSYLLDEPLDVFGSSSQKRVIEDDYEQTTDNCLVIDDVNYIDKLNELLGKLQSSRSHEQELIFSLLDRWRKARYMENESEDSYLFNDESTLSYFHVLELLGDLCSREIAAASKALLEEFCRNYNKEILSLSGQALESEAVAKAKILSSVLDKDITVYAKISYYLKKHGLFEQRTAYWIKTLIEARNSVAHGRRVFYDKAIFPVQPFFPLTSVDMYPLEFLRILTAKVIATHIGISLYDDEWQDILKYLNYGEQATKQFINEFDNKPTALLSETERSIVFGGLNELILSKKIKVASCINLYRFYINSDEGVDEFINDNIHAIILLLEETEDTIFSDELTRAIVRIYSAEEPPFFKCRDLIYYLDFHGFNISKLESLVLREIVR